MAKKKVLDAVVKRGRKSKRGRPKTKKEVVKKHDKTKPVEVNLKETVQHVKVYPKYNPLRHG